MFHVMDRSKERLVCKHTAEEEFTYQVIFLSMYSRKKQKHIHLVLAICSSLSSKNKATLPEISLKWWDLGGGGVTQGVLVSISQW